MGFFSSMISKFGSQNASIKDIYNWLSSTGRYPQFFQTQSGEDAIEVVLNGCGIDRFNIVVSIYYMSNSDSFLIFADLPFRGSQYNYPEVLDEINDINNNLFIGRCTMGSDNRLVIDYAIKNCNPQYVNDAVLNFLVDIDVSFKRYSFRNALNAGTLTY